MAMLLESLLVWITITYRIVLVFFASVMFGLERQQTHKPVGLGTFTFVALGSCALGVVAISNVVPNSASLLSGIVTGIGFLGAGALVRGTDRVYGFTTASAIWLFAIFGLTTGIGEYLIAGIVYALIWVVIMIDRYLEESGIGTYQRKLVVSANKIINEKDLHRLLITHTKHYKLLKAEIDKVNNEVNLTYLVDGPREHLNKMMQMLYQEEWFKSAKID
jgi:putative Mg2+ transporter-C (MgtC) family protein